MLTKDQAQKIVELTSSIYRQGMSWVVEVSDIKTGVKRLIRQCSEPKAQRNLKRWRKEQMELLLREDQSAKAYVLRVWHQPESWDGEGVWQWGQKNWYVTKSEAQEALKKKVDLGDKYQIFETPVSSIPGHFNVA